MKIQVSQLHKTPLHVCAVLLILAALVLGTVGLTPVAADSEPVLEFLEETPLVLKEGEEDEFAKTVTLHNKGSKLTELTFTAVLIDKDGQPYGKDIVLDADPKSKCEGDEGDVPCIKDGKPYIDGFTVAQFTLSIPAEEAKQLAEPLTGHIAIGTAEKVVTEAVALQLQPEVEDAADGDAKAFGFLKLNFATVMWIGLGAGALAFIVCFIWLSIEYEGSDWKDLWGGHLGKIEWKFDENWASTVTQLGGIATSIIGLTILPETYEFQFLTKTESIDEFAILGVIFALGVTLAPLIGTALTTLFPKKGHPGAARVWIYVLAVSLIVWTVTGQLLNGLTFLDEVRLGAEAYKGTAYALQGLLLALAVIAFLYAAKKTVNTILEIVVTRKQASTVETLGKLVREASEQLQNQKPLQGVVEQLEDELLDQEKQVIEGWVLASLKGEDGTTTLQTMASAVVDKLEVYCQDPKHGPQNAQILLQAVGIGVAALAEALKEKAEKPTAVLAAVTALHEKVTAQIRDTEDRQTKARDVGTPDAWATYTREAAATIRRLGADLGSSQPAAINAIREVQDKVPAIYLP